MTTKEETLMTLARTIASITKTVETVVENQNNTSKEVSKQQLDLLRYQCETGNELIKEMLNELKK